VWLNEYLIAGVKIGVTGLAFLRKHRGSNECWKRGQAKIKQLWKSNLETYLITLNRTAKKYWYAPNVSWLTTDFSIFSK